MVVYLDDLLSFNDKYEDHLFHLNKVLERLEENHVYLGKSKCEIMTSKTEFLRLKLGVEKVSVSGQTKNNKGMAHSTAFTDLRSFLG